MIISTLDGIDCIGLQHSKPLTRLVSPVLDFNIKLDFVRSIRVILEISGIAYPTSFGILIRPWRPLRPFRKQLLLSRRKLPFCTAK